MTLWLIYCICTALLYWAVKYFLYLSNIFCVPHLPSPISISCVWSLLTATPLLAATWQLRATAAPASTLDTQPSIPSGGWIYLKYVIVGSIILISTLNTTQDTVALFCQLWFYFKFLHCKYCLCSLSHFISTHDSRSYYKYLQCNDLIIQKTFSHCWHLILKFHSQ